jgi:hypothetical protein
MRRPKRHKPERNKKIATAVLNGKTLVSQADKFEISPERVRKLTLSYCRTENRTAYDKALADTQKLSGKYKHLPTIYCIRGCSGYFV